MPDHDQGAVNYIQGGTLKRKAISKVTLVVFRVPCGTLNSNEASYEQCLRPAFCVCVLRSASC